MSEAKLKLENLFWLGGSTCAGKTSISEIIASRFDVNVYHVDEAFEVHAQRFDPVLHTALSKWSASSWEQRWMQPIGTLVQDVIACYREHFSFVLEDVISRMNDGPLLVEGTALLPGQVTQVSAPGRAIWLIATADFQRTHYSKRDWARAIAAECSNPEEAFHNWMERDIQFAKWLEIQARDFYLPVLSVDGNRTMEENAEAVVRQFKLI